jgi:hypothetical protein
MRVAVDPFSHGPIGQPEMVAAGFGGMIVTGFDNRASIQSPAGADARIG